MSLVTGMCSDNTELWQKISKLGQWYRFLPFKYCLNDHRESYSILIFFVTFQLLFHVRLKTTE